MKTTLPLPSLLLSALILASCGPNSGSDSQSTTKTTTTTSTTSSSTPATTPADPATPPTAPVGPLTQANLDRIQKDMSQAEVEAILGPPSSSQSEPIPIVGGTKTTYSYQNGTSAVTVIFKNNQMQEKSGTFGP